jgi:hypothetical protein
MAPLRAILYLQVQHHVPQPSLTVAQQEELKFLLDLLFFSFKLHCCRNFGSKLSQSTNADKHKSMLTQAYHCLNQERHELLARSKKLAHPLDHQIISQVSTVPSINHNSSLQPR